MHRCSIWLTPWSSSWWFIFCTVPLDVSFSTTDYLPLLTRLSTPLNLQLGHCLAKLSNLYLAHYNAIFVDSVLLSSSPEESTAATVLTLPQAPLSILHSMLFSSQTKSSSTVCDISFQALNKRLMYEPLLLAVVQVWLHLFCMSAQVSCKVFQILSMLLQPALYMLLPFYLVSLWHKPNHSRRCLNSLQTFNVTVYKTKIAYHTKWLVFQ